MGPAGYDGKQGEKGDKVGMGGARAGNCCAQGMSLDPSMEK